MPSSNEPTTRVLERAQPRMRLRIVSGHTRTSGSHGPAWVHVEWAGRVGHPSSYGLLGGTRVDKSVVRIQPSGAKFRDSLASGADDVRWGSQPEFEVAILDALQSQPQGVLVSQAAHGAIGSSPYVFARLARSLAAFWRLRYRPKTRKCGASSIRFGVIHRSDRRSAKRTHLPLMVPAGS
jgi:hypothetical protein